MAALEVFWKINDNAYKIKPPKDLNISDIFNVADLKAYETEESLLLTNDNSDDNSRTSYF